MTLQHAFITTALLALAPLIASAGEKAAKPSEKNDPAEDTFFAANGAKGVQVAFDCSPKHSKSPYCMIRIKDLDNGVVCLGLVSSEKVVNPSLSCVPAK